jgi:hypothetical protein
MKDKKNWKIVYKIIQDYLEEEHGTPMMKKPYKDDGNLVFTDCDGNEFGVDELIDWYKTLVDDGNIDDDLGLLTTLDLIPSHSDSTDGLPSSAQIIGEPVRIGKLEVAQNDFPRKLWVYEYEKALTALGNGWRLPTKDELNLMYINRVAIGGFTFLDSDIPSTSSGPFTINSYWSSTEFDNYDAWTQNFTTGGQRHFDKGLYGYVRAVRDVPYKDDRGNLVFSSTVIVDPFIQWIESCKKVFNRIFRIKKN